MKKHQPQSGRSTESKSKATPSLSEGDDLPLKVVDRAANNPPSSHPWFRMSFLKRLRFVPVIILLIGTGGFIGLYFQPPGLQKFFKITGLQPGAGTSHPIAVPVEQGKDISSKVMPETIVGLGKLIPEGDITVVAMPSQAGEARVAELHVREGDRVTAGTLLATLDTEKKLKASVDVAAAAVETKLATLAEMRDTVLANRAEAQAELSRAEAAVSTAKTDFERFRDLKEKGYATAAVFESKRMTYEQSVQDVERARANLSRYDFTALDSQKDVLVARRELEAAQADLRSAEAALDDAYVRAPSSGTILSLDVRLGEKPGSKGLLKLGNIDDMTAEVEVYQSMIAGVTLGAAVTITSDALPEPLTGTVSKIGYEVETQTVTDSDPAANTDARVVKVTVGLTAESSKIARRYTNLQVTARITTAAAKQ
ncbi:MAG: HlyD family efflux transporter periplasmic adaptor subunit [Alphaproteobacteria bacterium]|nr:HlyD family efflux transporter periplasmic adaptor subunit [Alphaproteobacteria bacterium]